MIKEVNLKLAEKKNLTQAEVEAAMKEIMSGQARPDEIAGFLMGLREKGETVDEITGAAKVMRENVIKIKPKSGKLLDTCGTGGDKSNTFNISTVSAFVAAGAGAIVAKHGNRSISSKCGSADVLKELGVNIEVTPEIVEKCLNEIGIGFLYAPLLHPAMKYATPVRRQLGVRTIFNILGPLANPAGTRHQLLGVYDAKLTEPLANVLKNLGSIHALVVHGEGGLDEASTTSETIISELKNGSVSTYKIKPEDFGIKKASLVDLKGGDVVFNAALALDILNGKKGAQRDIVVLNAGAAIYAADMAENINTGVKLTIKSIDSGAALQKLEALKKLTN